MKILILTDSLNRGGAEKQLVLLAKQLNTRFEISVWSLHPGPFERELINSGVSVIIHSGTSTYRSVYKTLSVLSASYKPDIVHFFGKASLLAGFLPFKKVNIPIVNGTVRYGALARPLGIRVRNLLAARIGDSIVANSDAGLKASHTPVKNKYVIRNGFDIKTIDETIPVASDATTFRVTMCANITRFKDYASFIDTAKLITSKSPVPVIKFWAIGSPSSDAAMNRVKSQAETLVSEDLLHFTGGVDNPLQYLLVSNVGVLLSTNGEGISNSIMEYMACRIPVICSRVGGNSELVINNTTGFLVNPENAPTEIAEKIFWLSRNPVEARKMGEEGYNRLVNEFSVEKMVSSTIDVYMKQLSISTDGTIVEDGE